MSASEVVAEIVGGGAFWRERTPVLTSNTTFSFRWPLGLPLKLFPKYRNPWKTGSSQNSV
jgi:hypothetical protein